MEGAVHGQNQKDRDDAIDNAVINIHCLTILDSLMYDTIIIHIY